VTYGLLAAWVWRERLGIGRRRLALAVLAAAAGFLWTGGHRAPAGVRATFLAVGSGNTNLVELPNGRNLLYDAGSSLSYTRAGEGTIAPVLWWRGVVDAAFISHAHFDHFKDVLPLVERFGIRRVFVPPTFLRRRLSADDTVVEKLLARGVRVTYFGAGDALAGTGRARVRGVWPRGAASQTDDINDGSLVLAVEDGGRRLLLTRAARHRGVDWGRAGPARRRRPLAAPRPCAAGGAGPLPPNGGAGGGDLGLARLGPAAAARLARRGRRHVLPHRPRRDRDGGTGCRWRARRDVPRKDRPVFEAIDWGLVPWLGACFSSDT